MNKYLLALSLAFIGAMNAVDAQNSIRSQLAKKFFFTRKAYLENEFESLDTAAKNVSTKRVYVLTRNETMNMKCNEIDVTYTRENLPPDGDNYTSCVPELEGLVKKNLSNLFKEHSASLEVIKLEIKQLSLAEKIGAVVYKNSTPTNLALAYATAGLVLLYKKLG